MASELDLEQRTQVSLAETTNHIVGGLLSAFDMSRVEMFLNKAIELTDKLLVAFEGENQGELSEHNIGVITASEG